MLITHSLDAALRQFICESTGAGQVLAVDPLQSLWSQCGWIVRVHLADAPMPSVIVKQVAMPATLDHPRGWQGDSSRQRKQQS